MGVRDWITIVVIPLAIALVGLAGQRLAARAQAIKAETDGDLGLIDRWKEFAKTAEERTAEVERRMNARVDELARRIEALEADRDGWRAYAAVLVEHINANKPPPPPPKPTHLQ